MATAPRSLVVRVLLASALALPVGLVTAETASAVTSLEMEKKVLSLVNAERRKVGCSNLRWDTRLWKASRKHSWNMRTKDFFSHTSPDGRTPWDRMRAEGYAYGSAENIAAGQRTAAGVVRAWMNSSGHRTNILNCANKAVGIGVSRGASTYGTYWTQDFGRR